MTSTKFGQLFTLAYTKPLSTAGAAQPGSYMYFYQSGGYSIQQQIYTSAGLNLNLGQPVVADANGRFTPVYLNPALIYSWQLYSASGALLQQADPINSQNVSIPVVALKPANTVRVSTTTLAADPDLSIPLPAAGTYRVELDLLMVAGAAGTTPGIAFEINYSGPLNASAGNTFALVGTLNGSPPVSPQTSFAINTPVTAIPLSIVYPTNVIRIAGTIQVTGPGTLALFWAQNVSSATGTAVGASSDMTVTRIG